MASQLGPPPLQSKWRPPAPLSSSRYPRVAFATRVHQRLPLLSPGHGDVRRRGTVDEPTKLRSIATLRLYGSCDPAVKLRHRMDLHDGQCRWLLHMGHSGGAGRSWSTRALASNRRGRRRTLLHEPADLLAQAGITGTGVTDVILTHLHYDHAGGLDQFPVAQFHLQDDEMSSRRDAHVPCPSARPLKQTTSNAVRLAFKGRGFHKGDAACSRGRPAPHRRSFRVAVVRVATARACWCWPRCVSLLGEPVRRAPFPIVYHMGEMLDGFVCCVTIGRRQSRSAHSRP
jgi:hypothetical protein